MTDTPSTLPHCPVPAATLAHAPPAPLALGFLAVVHEPTGVLGGYLLTNAWGRPLEFRLSTAVQPNRVQQILYGPTLTEYLHADLIGKTLIEKTSGPPTLVVTDSLPALALREKLGLPVLAVADGGSAEHATLVHPRSSVPLLFASRYEAERGVLEELLERIDPAVDLAEPFARIREAVAEARKMGATNRAA